MNNISNDNHLILHRVHWDMW